MADIRYIDLEGLGKFLDNIKASYADGANGFNAKLDGSGNEIAATYVPVTRTIAGKALSADIAKEDLLEGLGVQAEAEKNVIIGIKFKGKGDTAATDLPVDTNRTVTIDVSAYAKTADLASKVDTLIETGGNKARIFNEADGGGAKYEKADGKWSFVGVNNFANDADGIGAQLYSVDTTDNNKGSILDVTLGGIYYHNGAGMEPSARHAAEKELAVKGDVTGAIAALDAEVTSTDGAKVAVKVTEADGKITAVNVTESDIASAALLGTTSDDETKTTAFGYIAKEAYDRSTADNALNERINALEGRGRYLTTWDCTTGLPETNPSTVSPYIYKSGDYYLVGKVATGTDKNYRPTGDRYIFDPSVVPSEVEETSEVKVGDQYLYDGANWVLMSGTTKTVTFAQIAGNATDNSSLVTEFAKKVDTSRTVNSKALSADIVLNGADIKLDGYSIAISASAVAATDTVNEAIGKVEYKVGHVLDGVTATVIQDAQPPTNPTGLALTVAQENGLLKSVSGSIATATDDDINALFT